MSTVETSFGASVAVDRIIDNYEQIRPEPQVEQSPFILKQAEPTLKIIENSNEVLEAFLKLKLNKHDTESETTSATESESDTVTNNDLLDFPTFEPVNIVNAPEQDLFQSNAKPDLFQPNTFQHHATAPNNTDRLLDFDYEPRKNNNLVGPKHNLIEDSDSEYSSIVINEPKPKKITLAKQITNLIPNIDEPEEPKTNNLNKLFEKQTLINSILELEKGRVKSDTLYNRIYNDTDIFSHSLYELEQRKRFLVDSAESNNCVAISASIVTSLVKLIEYIFDGKKTLHNRKVPNLTGVGMYISTQLKLIQSSLAEYLRSKIAGIGIGSIVITILSAIIATVVYSITRSDTPSTNGVAVIDTNNTINTINSL